MTDFQHGLDICISIINCQYKSWDDRKDDDIEFVYMIKTVVDGFNNYLTESDCDGASRDEMSRALYEHAKKLYVCSWIKNGLEEESAPSKEDLRKEGAEYFDYIFEHEEHPF